MSVRVNIVNLAEDAYESTLVLSLSARVEYRGVRQLQGVSHSVDTHTHTYVQVVL